MCWPLHRRRESGSMTSHSRSFLDHVLEHRVVWINTELSTVAPRQHQRHRVPLCNDVLLHLTTPCSLLSSCQHHWRIAWHHHLASQHHHRSQRHQGLRQRSDRCRTAIAMPRPHSLCCAHKILIPPLYRFPFGNTKARRYWMSLRTT
jgi:hypothetical protein